jgi:RNA polymerase sigma factor (TIGR02999 family)
VSERDGEITRLLLDWSGGNEKALEALFPLVYEELRSMAQLHLRRERTAHTLQRTALVHEAFLRLIDQKSVDWQSRAHFFGLASQMMRRILVDYARKRAAAKRGGNAARIDIDEIDRSVNANAQASDAAPSLPTTNEGELDFSEFDRVLTRLQELEPRPGKLVELRFFGGLSLDEAAEVIGVSRATVKRDWVFARAWLQRELAGRDA